MNTFFTGYAACLVRVAREMEAALEGCHVWTEVPVHAEHSTCTLSSEWRFRDCTRAEHISKKYSSTLKVIFRIRQSTSHMLKECEELEIYMHRLKIARPNLALNFLLNVGGAKSSSLFGGDRHLGKDRRKPALDIEHYISVDDCYEGSCKLQLRTSPFFKLSGGRRSTGLRLTVCAALLPPPVPGAVLLNTDCTHLQMLIYGPDRLPLLLPGVAAAAIHADSWLQLTEYGLRVGPQVQELPSRGNVLPDYRCKLLPLDANEEEVKDGSCQKHTIQIFIFLDEDGPRDMPSSTIDLIDHLRQNLSGTVSRSRSKLKKGLNAALSKLLHNHQADQQKQQLMDMAIPEVCGALTDLVRRSTSHSFRTAALTCLQAADSQSLHQEVNKRLWSIASDKYNVQSQHPQETPCIVENTVTKMVTDSQRPEKRVRCMQSLKNGGIVKKTKTGKAENDSYQQSQSQQSLCQQSQFEQPHSQPSQFPQSHLQFQQSNLLFQQSQSQLQFPQSQFLFQQSQALQSQSLHSQSQQSQSQQPQFQSQQSQLALPQKLPSHQSAPPQQLPPKQLPSRQSAPPQQMPPQQLPSRQLAPPPKMPSQQLPSHQSASPQQMPPQQLPSHQSAPPQQMPSQQLSSCQSAPPQQMQTQQLPSRQSAPPQQTPPHQLPSRQSVLQQLESPRPSPHRSAESWQTTPLDATAGEQSLHVVDTQCQDLDSFDLLGLDLGPDSVLSDLGMDTAVVLDDMDSLYSNQGSLLDISISDIPDSFDLFGCDINSLVGFEEDWLSDILSRA